MCCPGYYHNGFVATHVLGHMMYCNTFFFKNWDSLHARLNSHYEAWSYKKKKHKKITACRKLTVKRCLLILDLKPLRS